jgi:hypothetical protein
MAKPAPFRSLSSGQFGLLVLRYVDSRTQRKMAMKTGISIAIMLGLGVASPAAAQTV